MPAVNKGQMMILDLLKNNGVYRQEATAVYKYLNSWGGVSYLVITSQEVEQQAIHAPTVCRPQLLWHHTTGLTGLGEAEVKILEEAANG